ncbi:MAG TPA: homocysteine S-methyltransferase [Gaiellaceae bacterium]|nr:homocysteine S-methyltransferase [Gaiellaceae bacterium]
MHDGNESPGALAALLARGDLVLDGGFATELEARGHDLRDSLWSARLLRDDPQAIEDVHAAYFEAGADIAITASYQATFEGFAERGIEREEAARLLRLSVELARRARARTGGIGLVAGSVGPYCVVWANGAEYTGDYTGATDDQIATTQRARIVELAAAGADVIALETIPNGREAVVVGELLAELPQVEAWVSFCCRDGAHLSDGTSIEDAIRAAGRTGRVAAFGINCTPPEHIASLLEAARRVTDVPLLVYPNGGRAWDEATYTWSGIGVDHFPAGLIERWRALGARGIGGCCGIGPTAIAELARA